VDVPSMANNELLNTEKRKKCLENETKNEIIENFEEFSQLKHELTERFAEIDAEIQRKFKKLYE
ncbi:hypothetical protein THOM_1168, partial [Trachipleistophora hominis]